ncbi:MAG: DUF1573 domain-containing protein [Mucilaginibacter polytrichastri]|nr:DUF1573 domain-containing protein [Mucilaginibacter polytrichastri]
MKRYAFLFILGAALSACDPQSKSQPATATPESAGSPEAAANATTIKFDEDTFDFGKVKQGDKVTHEYAFTNTGEKPLIISDARATCGCTVPEPPKEPIKPGEKGTIKVVFNSAGKSGLQDKQVFITANTNPTQTTVHLVGEVVTK